MNNLLIRFLVAIGIFSFFDGTSSYFSANAKESSSNAGASQASDTMGRSGGCGKCN